MSAGRKPARPQLVDGAVQLLSRAKLNVPLKQSSLPSQVRPFVACGQCKQRVRGDVNCVCMTRCRLNVRRQQSDRRAQHARNREAPDNQRPKRNPTGNPANPRTMRQARYRDRPLHAIV
jgi:hypothetical protein